MEQNKYTQILVPNEMNCDVQANRSNVSLRGKYRVYSIFCIAQSYHRRKSYFGNIELKMHDQNMDKIVRRQNDHKTLPTFLHSMEIFRQRFTPVHKS